MLKIDNHKRLYKYDEKSMTVYVNETATYRHKNITNAIQWSTYDLQQSTDVKLFIALSKTIEQKSITKDPIEEIEHTNKYFNCQERQLYAKHGPLDKKTSVYMLQLEKMLSSVFTKTG